MSVYFILIYKLCLKKLLIYFIIFEKKIFLFFYLKILKWVGILRFLFLKESLNGVMFGKLFL